MLRRGFTLIEALIYLALFTIILMGVVVAAYALFETNARNETAAMLQEEKEFLLAKVSHLLDTTDLVSLPLAGGSGAVLSVVPFGSGSLVTVSGGGGNLEIDGVVLNNTNVTITGLSFDHVYAGGVNPQTVTMTFTISAKTSSGRDVSQEATLTRSIKH
jgi:hypothetical protein